MEPFFIYFIKSATVLTVFHACYYFFLRKETFFTSNRLFMLGGILVALLLPFWVIKKVVIIDTLLPLTAVPTTGSTESTVVTPFINWPQTLFYIYLMGMGIFAARFTMQLISLFRLIHKNKIVKRDGFHLIAATDVTTPFSFFKYIVYNPEAYTKAELDIIIAHEKVHARQWHSIDMVLSHLLCIFQWINPLAWSYKNSIAQNLEYLADKETQENMVSRKAYQYLMLKTTVGNHQLSITNTFFNSLIKKRIVMLNTHKSQQRKAWKYAIALPLLALFMLTANTKTVAQVKKIKMVEAKEGRTVIEVILDKDTSDEELKKETENFKKEGLSLTFSKVKRNKDNEITSINVELKSTGGYVSNYSISNSEPIEPFMVHAAFDEKGNGKGYVATVGYGGTKHVVVEEIHEMEPGDKKGKKVEKKVYEYTTSDEEVNEEKHIKVSVNDTNGVNVVFSGDTDGNPLIIIDGKEASEAAMKKLKSNQIETVNVRNDPKYVKKYGEKAKDGVIEITLKKEQ
ncbi:M56 family metallopeptidase [Leptobacterium sp. I13]|uniref:M56 family metallopeptidase n=1 Tax=Leptobacterium meishanense TaxID=3128904 RepID=UPI0030EE6B41